MKKMKLELNALRGESFDAAGAQPGQGTVAGNEYLAGSISYCLPCFFTQQADRTREGC